MYLIISILLLAIWLIAYSKNKKAIFVVPCLFMIFITPIYIVLDQNFFVEIFGCGCVPSVRTNMFNIPFNANDLRLVIYSIITIAMTILGGFNARKINNTKFRIIYIFTICLVNVILGFKICQFFVWN